jgi:hypothetical protein
VKHFCYLFYEDVAKVWWFLYQEAALKLAYEWMEVFTVKRFTKNNYEVSNAEN